MARCDAVELAAGHVELAVALGAGRQHDRVEARRAARRRRRRSRPRSRSGSDALGLDLLDPAVDQPLLELEVGDAVAQQAAGRRRRARTPSPRGRRGRAAGRRPGRPGPSRSRRRCGRSRAAAGCGVDPALGERALGDRVLDLLDRHRVVVEREDAGLLARRRAEPAGELGEVVGRVQRVDGLAPAAACGRARSSRGSGCRAGSRCGRTARRSPCSGRPARATCASLGREVHVAVVGDALGHRAVAGRAAGRLAGSREGQPRGLAAAVVSAGLARAAGAGRAASPVTKPGERRLPARRAARAASGEPVSLGVPLRRRRAQRASSSSTGLDADDVEVDRVRGAPGRVVAGTRRRRTCRRRSCGRSGRAPRPRRRSCTRSRGRRRPRRPPSRRCCAPRSARRRRRGQELAAGRAVQRGVADATSTSARRPRRPAGARPAGRRTGPCRCSRCTGPSSSSVRPRGANAPRLCPPMPAQLELDRAVGQARRAVAAGDLAGQQRADAAVACCARRRSMRTGVPRVERRRRRGDQLVRRARRRARGPGTRRAARGAPGPLAPAPAAARGRARGPRPALGRRRAQQVGAADQLVERARAQRGEQLAHLLGEEQEVADDVLGRAGEAPPQLGILRRDARPGRCSGGRRASSRSRRRPAGRSRTRTPRRRAAPRPARRAPCAARRRPAGARGRAGRSCTSTCCVSARPSSHGRPACLIEDSGDAPVPPSWPAITMWSALALATPAATVPTPASATSLTEISALGLTHCRSWISCARSSIE